MFVLGFVSFLALTLKVLIDKYMIHSYQIYKKSLYAFCSLLLLLINLIFLPYFYFCLMVSSAFIFMYIFGTVKGIWIFEAENLEPFLTFTSYRILMNYSISRTNYRFVIYNLRLKYLLCTIIIIIRDNNKRYLKFVGCLIWNAYSYNNVYIFISIKLLKPLHFIIVINTVVFSQKRHF